MLYINFLLLRNISGRRKRRGFKRLLKEHGLISLYSKFVEAGVDEETLWELDDEFLDDAQLTAIQKLRYRKTKEKLFGPGRIDLSLLLKKDKD